MESIIAQLQNKTIQYFKAKTTIEQIKSGFRDSNHHCVNY